VAKRKLPPKREVKDERSLGKSKLDKKLEILLEFDVAQNQKQMKKREKKEARKSRQETSAQS